MVVRNPGQRRPSNYTLLSRYVYGFLPSITVRFSFFLSLLLIHNTRRTFAFPAVGGLTENSPLGIYTSLSLTLVHSFIIPLVRLNYALLHVIRHSISCKLAAGVKAESQIWTQLPIVPDNSATQDQLEI